MDRSVKKRGDSMNIDIGQLDQLLNKIPYPISTTDLVQFAKQHSTNDRILGLLERLPNKTFNSPEDIKNTFGILGNLGNLGSFKL
jgi:uncharacterized protein DUF2795